MREFLHSIKTLAVVTTRKSGFIYSNLCEIHLTWNVETLLPQNALFDNGENWSHCHASRSYPGKLMAWLQMDLKSTCSLVNPFHTATWLRERTSLGLDWLGTRSSHKGHVWDSSKKKIRASNLLQGQFLDQVFKKLPRTDSLSVNATTLWPSHTGPQISMAVSKASISNSWMMFFWFSCFTVSTKLMSTFSLKKLMQLPEDA